VANGQVKKTGKKYKAVPAALRLLMASLQELRKGVAPVPAQG
jgi:hypothetical protein